jgi:thiamine biosynthesis lipoprotein
VTTAMKARLQLLRDPVPLGPPLDLGRDCRAENRLPSS